MSTRSFLALAVSVIVVGGVLGGLFIGGYELGKRNAPAQDLAMADLATLPSPGGGAVLTAEGGPDKAMLSEIRQALGSGQLQGDFGQRGGGLLGLAGAFGGGAPGGGVFGTIEAVEGDVVRVSTPQGALEVKIGVETDIQGIAELALEDLEEGRSVTVTGQRDEGGAMTATSVFVLPEGAGAFGGFGGFGGGGITGRGFEFGQRGGSSSETAEQTEENE